MVSAQTTRLPRNLTFAHAAEKVGQGQSGHSRVPTDDREKFGAERLHPMLANWRCRPGAELQASGLPAVKQSFALNLEVGSIRTLVRVRSAA